MGLPLMLSVIFLALAALLALCGVLLKRSRRKSKFIKNIDSFITLLVLFQLVTLFIAVGIKDPLLEQIPAEIQLIGAALSGIFAFWKYYLDPLKQRIVRLEIGQGEMKTDIGNIKSDIHLIKESVLQKGRV